MSILHTLAPVRVGSGTETTKIPPESELHRVRPDGTCECRRRVTCAMDDAWWKSSRHRDVAGNRHGSVPSLLPGRRRLRRPGGVRELRSMT
ncbi:hypothetical protein EVAR_13571_1 [Eumeta japonica]|uniref:Uncharacterized protein n=1 Tax=Eumeta variegata TaxID=151549 RepID=A0A4C1U9L1_EUMVA|nr:hypothetical protein EVAR_13571_1 [Eumeta japonica]